MQSALMDTAEDRATAKEDRERKKKSFKSLMTRNGELFPILNFIDAFNK